MVDQEEGKKLSTLLVVVNVLGVVLSIVALRSHIRAESGATSFCNISALFNCDAVNASKWSSVLSIPLGAWGVIFHSFLSCVAIATFSRWRKSNMSVIFSLSFFASLYSLFLLYISKVQIGAFCIVCIGMYAINFINLGFSWFDLRGTSFWGRFIDALKAALAYPKALLGLGEYRKTDAASLALFGFIITLGMMGLAAWLPVMFLPPLSEVNEQPDKPTERMAIDSWRSAKAKEIVVDPESDIVVGKSNAPVQIVEYFDFECPACRVLYPRLHRLMEREPERVQFIARNYPLNPECNSNVQHAGHASACDAAFFALCAHRQGKGAEAINFLFSLPSLDAHQPREVVKSEMLEGVPSLGLDAGRFTTCFNQKEPLPNIKKILKESESFDIPGTPTVLINGRPVNVQAEGALEAIFEEALR